VLVTSDASEVVFAQALSRASRKAGSSLGNVTSLSWTSATRRPARFQHDTFMTHPLAVQQTASHARISAVRISSTGVSMTPNRSCSSQPRRIQASQTHIAFSPPATLRPRDRGAAAGDCPCRGAGACVFTKPRAGASFTCRACAWRPARRDNRYPRPRCDPLHPCHRHPRVLPIAVWMTILRRIQPLGGRDPNRVSWHIASFA
jgi:hypothetical protein